MKKIPKIIVCLLLIVLALSFTACTQKAATEQEVRTVELDGLKYSIINTLDGDTVTDTYAKVTGYVGAAENVTIPATVEDIKVLTIGGLAFYSKSVKSITLPEGVTTIENFAFGYSDIISVDIPSTVTRIGDYAFIHC
ncbi:MAG: leucine-rich repeat domain-containing protein, partial [Clostridia bacterium]|nr:leucine-rich repeat domain-containing protein [Clostridia bacterium]